MSTPTTERFTQLVPIHNPSGGEEAMRQYILQQLAALHVTNSTVDAVGNVLAYVPGQLPGPATLLCAHMDSVPPCEGIVPVADVKDGRPIIRSAGRTILGADDKAGIAVILEVLSRLHTAPHLSLELLFTVKEEIGLLGARDFDTKQSQSHGALVLDGEGSVGDVFYAGPTHKHLLFELEGIACHAGIAPEKGLSAIVMAAELITQVPSGRLSPDTTLNLGQISGGAANNVVPGMARIEGEARSHDAAALEQLMQQVMTATTQLQQRYPQGKATFTPTHKYDGFVVGESASVYQQAMVASRFIGIEPHAKRMNIGSDAHRLNHAGLPAVVLGMGFHHSHSFGEFVYVDELEQVTQWVLAAIQNPLPASV